MNPCYRVQANGVSMICNSQESVLEWCHYALDNGMAPTVTLMGSEE